MKIPITRTRTILTRRLTYPAAPNLWEQSAITAEQLSPDQLSNAVLVEELRKAWEHIAEVHAIIASMRVTHRNIVGELKRNNRMLIRHIDGWKRMVAELEADRDRWQSEAVEATKKTVAAWEALRKLNTDTLVFMEARRNTMAVLRNEFHALTADYDAGRMKIVQRRIERLYESFDAFVKTNAEEDKPS